MKKPEFTMVPPLKETTKTRTEWLCSNGGSLQAVISKVKEIIQKYPNAKIKIPPYSNVDVEFEVTVANPESETKLKYYEICKKEYEKQLMAYESYLAVNNEERRAQEIEKQKAAKIEQFHKLKDWFKRAGISDEEIEGK